MGWGVNHPFSSSWKLGPRYHDIVDDSSSPMFTFSFFGGFLISLVLSADCSPCLLLNRVPRRAELPPSRVTSRVLPAQPWAQPQLTITKLP